MPDIMLVNFRLGTRRAQIHTEKARPTQLLQQTAAAMPDSDSSLLLGAAAAAELCRYANEKCGQFQGSGQFMTEAEWSSCADPSAMLTFVIPRASERKMRLFVMACA